MKTEMARDSVRCDLESERRMDRGEARAILKLSRGESFQQTDKKGKDPKEGCCGPEEV